MPVGTKLRPGVNRRELLQVGCSGLLGLSLPTVYGGRAAAAPGTAVPGTATPGKRATSGKSVILVFQSGGGSHLDTFDPKPEAPDSTRGEFGVIDTTLADIKFSEHVPHLAQRTDRLAIVRSMAHSDNRHLSGTHNTLTGTVQPFRGNSNEDKELNRGDWPNYGGALNYLAPRNNGLPSHVTVPNPLIEGSLTWPGQHAGFLRAAHDPWVLKSDPSSKDFKVDGLAFPDGLSVSRLQSRRDLLTRYNVQNGGLDNWARQQQFTSQQENAYTLLTSGKVAQAFDIKSETEKMRDRYGRNKSGQTLLLARRLVQAGVPVVQCNMGIVQSWDTHTDNWGKLKNTLLPGLDLGVAALLDDLTEQGMIDDTLVIVVGEFGRTPRISTLAGQSKSGRDHWAMCYTALFAGGGVKGGQVIGASDRIGGYPRTPPHHPNDLGATVYHTLGIEPHIHVPDKFGRPIMLNQGKVMDVLYT
jgi:hypothetical protein